MGTGKGIKIIDIINALKIKRYNVLKSSNELKISLANTKKIEKILSQFKIKSVENFFISKGFQDEQDR